jgi:phage terminase large subunit-like protein
MQTGERWTFGTPHPAQEEVLCSPQRFVLFRGGLGSGKTWVGVTWAMANVLLHSDRTSGVIIAPTYTMLDDVIRPQIDEWWPRMVVNTYHGTERSFTFPNGSKVFLRSAERPGRLRGTEYGWAWIDEPAECKEEIFTVITGRLRAQTRAKHQVLLTGTPSGYNWVHEMFGEPHEKHAEGFHVVVAPTEDNAHNLPEGYIDSLRNLYSARLAEQELSGKWSY